jgi:hypothetical protein
VDEFGRGRASRSLLANCYAYDPKDAKYLIGLKYVFYDVFGLDDDDVNEYGAKSESLTTPAAAVGITAWWQLQHQHRYAPLVTRIILERTFEVPAT